MDGSMLDRMLPWAVVALTIVSWLSAYVLVRAAWQKPRIGALNERAAIAVLIALFGTVSTILVFNTEADHLLLDAEWARVLFRLCLLALLGIPAYWTWLYRSGRLGSGQ